MGNQHESKEDLTAEEGDQPPWKAGIEEARRIMEACLKAAQELCRDHYAEAGMSPAPIQDQNVPNVAIAMYQSVVMMEMERGRIDGLKMQMLAGGLEVPGPQLLRR